MNKKEKIWKNKYMSVLSAHGVTLAEVNHYDSIYSLSFFSIAENTLEDKERVLKAFIHSHEEYEFIIPITTMPLLYYEKANYIGEVGYVYPVNPFVRHGIDVDLHSKVISITVDQKYFDAIKSQLGYKDKYFYTRFLYKKNLLDLIKKFEEEYVNKGGNLVFLADSIIKLLIELGLQSGEDNRRPERKYAKNMKNILLYIENNYTDVDLTIAKIAEMSGYSITYFTKAFKKYMHDTPIMHLNKMRISQAKVYFENSDLTIQEIAHKVGYKNISTFTEAFKRVMGMTPNYYRKKFM